MSKIIGVTVGTPLSTDKIKEKMGITAGDVKFTDGDTFQQKYDSGELKGDPGDPGYTPQKGTDYFTEADKQELVSAVLANFTNVSEVGM